jgi:hypothetical protein
MFILVTELLVSLKRALLLVSLLPIVCICYVILFFVVDFIVFLSKNIFPDSSVQKESTIDVGKMKMSCKILLHR